MILGMVGVVATTLAYSICVAADRVGYIDCLPGMRSSPVLIFEHPCIPQPVGEISCGQKVEVIGPQGAWLEFKMPDRSHRFIGTASVSKDPHRFVPLAPNAAVVPFINLAECNAIRAKLYVVATQQRGEVATFPIEGVDEGSISILTVRIG